MLRYHNINNCSLTSFKHCSDSEYDELDTRGDDHYWQTERPLFVDSAHAYALTTPHAPTTLSFHSDRVMSAHNEDGLDTSINPAALQKLLR